MEGGNIFENYTKTQPRFHSAPSVSAGFDLLADFSASLGYPDVLYARTSAKPINMAGSIDGTPDGVTIFRRWNTEWETVYNRERFHFTNPVWDQARYTTKPFRFSDISPTTPQQRRFIEIATMHRQMNGFVVPIRGPGPTVGALSVAGAEHDHSISDQDITDITAAFYAFHIAMDRFFGEDSVDHYNLTEREITWLKLMAHNDCTLKDIADRTGVSDAVVKTGLSKLRAKFKTATNTRLVHLATKAGIV